MGTVRPCSGCNNPVEDASPHRRWHEACYRQHKSAVENARQKAQREASKRPRFCTDCPASIDDRPTGTKYCHDCARMRNYAITTAWYARERLASTAGRVCQSCPADISDRRSNARWCASCTEKRKRDRVSAHRAERRSKGWGFNRDKVFRMEIYARDRYVCHICGLPTSKEFDSKDPLSPVIDHLIPLGLPESPGHLWENAACAHKHCNSAKGNRVRPADWDLYHRLCRRKKKEDLPRHGQHVY